MEILNIFDKKCKICKKWIETAYVSRQAKSGKINLYHYCVKTKKMWINSVCPNCVADNKKEKRKLTPRFSKIWWWKCEYCNKTFYTKTSRKSKVCSSKCRQNLLEKTTNYYSNYQKSKSKNCDKVCQICHKNFKSRNPNKKNCSEICLKEAKRRLSRKRYQPKTKNCSVCKKEFQGKSSYCSENCKPKKII